MGDFKYTLQKNKNKIIAGVSLVAIIGAGFGLYTLFNKPEVTPEEEEYVDTGIKKADYIFLANEEGNIDLYGTKEDKIVNTLELDGSNVIFSRDDDLETIMAYSGGTFYELSEKDGIIEKKDIIKYSGKESIKSFKFSNEYIVGITDNEIIVIDISNNKTNSLKIKDVDTYVIAEKTLVYSIGDFIYSKNLTNDNEPVKIEIGDKSDALFFVDGKIIGFNNFGGNNKKTTILKMKANDLYIEFADKHDNDTVYPLTPDSDDIDIKFIDSTKRDDKVTVNSHYSMTMKENEKNTKDRVALPDDSSDKVYSPENTVSTKGYFYTNKDGNLTIFDLRAENVNVVVNTDKTFFMPILK